MIRRNHILTFATLLLFIGLPSCNDEEEGLKTDIESKIDEIVDNNINVNTDPGFVLLIQNKGKLELRKAYGLANVQDGRIYRPDTKSYIGSISKQFTATAIMLLAERDLLNVDQHISEYFPEYPEIWKDVTIHHLLTHQSGISDYLNDHGYAFDGMTNSDALNYIIENGYINFEPGEMFKYSNTGYIILAELVKRITGTSLDIFCKEEIFLPLGMENTYFINENTQVPNDMAVGHDLNGELFDYTIRTNGDGGMISTVDDMLIWNNSHHSNLIVSHEIFNTMISPFSNIENGTYYGYGYILDNYEGFDLPSGNGGFAGIFAYAGRIEENNFYICLMGNSPNYKLFDELISTSLEYYFLTNN
jgi:CubicO group peptidase (beta-lactamase class C family)